MRRILLPGVLLLTLLYALSAFAQETTFVGQRKAKADEVLVKFKTGRSSEVRERVHGKVGARVLRNFQRVGWQRVKLPHGLTVSDAIARYTVLADILEVEPNYVLQVNAVPNDPALPQLWGMTKISAPAAWDAATGSANVVVAVVDSGIDYSHNDLRANMWTNTGEIPGNGIDDDRNGYIDDVYGINAITNTGNPMDDLGHGTHVAGTIGAVGNNGLGVAGVNWSVKLMALKFIKSDRTGLTSDAIECYDYLLAMKQKGVNIRVVNNSWGGGSYSKSLVDALTAAGNAGILSVVAAGNNAGNNDVKPDYPASYNLPSIISVASADSADAPAPSSNYGATSVHLAAPGVQILSTLPGANNYGYMSGTSMAAPHVAGAAALLIAKSPGLSVASVRAALLNNVDQLSQWAGKVATGGRLNLARAMQSLTGGTNPPPPPPTATRQPDLLIRTNTGSAFVGDNVYGSSTSVAQQTPAGTTAIYQLSLQNDGSAADSFLVTGTASGSGWTVRYYSAASGGTDITTQVTSSGWRTTTLHPAGAVPIRVEVTPGSTVAAGATREVVIAAASTADSAKRDTVRALTTAALLRATLTGVQLATTPDSPQRVYTPIVLKANATGGPAEFMFRVGKYSATGITWHTLRDYGSYPITVWRPASAGSYLLMVYARTPGAAGYDVYASKLFTVK